MLRIGEYNTLEICKFVDFGAYLLAGGQEILLPAKYVPEGVKVGDKLNVFIYRDGEDRLIATTLTPLAVVGEFACLRVVDIAPFGAFLEWGIEKDLLVPLREMQFTMRVGESHVVYVYIDPQTDRITASSHLHKFMDTAEVELEEGEKVSVMVVNRTDLGYNLVVNQRYWGLVYQNEIFQPIKPGEELTAYVKKVREDGKVDIALRPQGFKKVIDGDTQKVLKVLQKSQGKQLPLSDKSAPEAIYEHLQMSKKAFKKAIGVLYKQNKISITENSIKLKV